MRNFNLLLVLSALLLAGCQSESDVSKSSGTSDGTEIGNGSKVEPIRAGGAIQVSSSTDNAVLDPPLKAEPPSEFCDSCSGVWNVYGSIPNGWVWWEDKTGEDARASRIQDEANRVIRKLSACGIAADVSLSDWFDTFTPNLAVVHSARFKDSKLAAVELAQAKSCGISGYSKSAFLQIAGND